MLRIFGLLLFFLLAAFVVLQIVVPALRDQPLFPWFRYRHLYRERSRARASRYEATLREQAASEWRAAYREQDATTKESTRWPVSESKTDGSSVED